MKDLFSGYPVFRSAASISDSQNIETLLCIRSPSGNYRSVESRRIAEGSQLIRFTDEQIIAALARVRLECRFISLVDVTERISGAGKDDGRPGPEAAWAMCPKDEEASVVWTDEMSEAFASGVRQLLRDGDPIAARMAFREHYQSLLDTARRDGIPVRWSVSLGWDKADRFRALSEAVEKNRLTQSHAMNLLGPQQQDELRLALTGDTPTCLLPGEVTRMLPGLAGLLQQMRMQDGVPSECEPGPPKRQKMHMTEQELRSRRDHLLRQAEVIRKQRAASGSAQPEKAVSK